MDRFAFFFIFIFLQNSEQEMDKKTRNPPDSDTDLPPSYDESSGHPQYSPSQEPSTSVVEGSSPQGQDERTALLNGVLERERQFPIAALFFLFGWFCPPLWFIGMCCGGSSNRYENWWGKVNFIMAMATILTSIIYSIVGLSTGHWLLSP
ncbi:hypothetical protein BCR42DRAFT_492571 [Absidia repens]|uniref:Uncharacterized protein n=1 Tax=Absidia repens TaxID=90262 RepID=A0A1X2IE64_9FUNG|nr:hypothetical protein BCR42DRAFT_492571 [Absidia repens]